MVKEARYILTDVVDNHNKFWNITLNGTSVKTQWGRVGEEGASKPFLIHRNIKPKLFLIKNAGKKRKRVINFSELLTTVPLVQKLLYLVI